MLIVLTVNFVYSILLFRSCSCSEQGFAGHGGFVGFSGQLGFSEQGGQSGFSSGGFGIAPAENIFIIEAIHIGQPFSQRR
jgi:hypothetical protein